MGRRRAPRGSRGYTGSLRGEKPWEAGVIVSVITSRLSVALYVGVPVFALLFLVSLICSDD